MTKRIPLFATSALAAAVLAACGGSGGGNGGGGNGSSTSTGTFIDEPVAGLGYDDGSGNSGTTNSTGEFEFASDATVTFSIGDLTLGSGQPNSTTSVVTPATLAGSETVADNPQAQRIAQLLQSLESNRSDATITITSQIRSRFSGDSITFDQDITGDNADPDGSIDGPNESAVEVSLSDLENLLTTDGATVEVPDPDVAGGTDNIGFESLLGRLIDDVTDDAVSEGDIIPKSRAREALVAAIDEATPDTGSGGVQLAITDDPANLSNRGQWGGFVINGFGETNEQGVQRTSTEAVPTGVQRFYGNDDNNDNSGDIQYVVVAESGVPFRPDEEVQGITIEAVGQGTTMSHLQILGSEDDGVELFGGAVNLSNVVINGQADDGLDFDEGNQSVIEKALVRTGSATSGDGIEADTEGPSADAPPRSQTDFVNVTILGNSSGNGGNWRRGFGGNFVRSAMVDDSVASGSFANGCVEINDQVDTSMGMRDVVFDCQAGENNTADFVAGTLASQFFDDALDENDDPIPAAARDFIEPDSVTINSNTLAITSTTNPGLPTTDDAVLTSSVSDNGSANNPLPDNDYQGAVDPTAPNADGDPSTAGPFWDGWTYIDPANVSGSLPLASSNLSVDTNGDGTAEDIFHPLADNFGNEIVPASSPDCPVGTPLGSNVEIADGAVSFPVCRLTQPITSDVTLTNDHVYLLTQTIQVGDGGGENAEPNTVSNVTVSVEGGTQIYGTAGLQTSFVVTAGSQLDTQPSSQPSTADLPIVMGAVRAEFQ